MERTEKVTRSEVEVGIRALSGKQSQAKGKNSVLQREKKMRMGMVVRRAETCSLKGEL